MIGKTSFATLSDLLLKRMEFRAIKMIAIACCFLSIGCQGSLRNEYGESEGSTARASPGGLNLFRNLCEAKGHRTRTVRSLTPRGKAQLNAFVWAPNYMAGHKVKTLDWFDDWLSQGGRTLIYVGRDFSPMADYWRQVVEDHERKNSPPQQIRLAQEKLATEDAAIDQMRCSVPSESVSPWCILKSDSLRGKQISALQGPWADEVEITDGRWFLRSRLEELDSDAIRGFKDELQTLLDANTTSSTLPSNAPEPYSKKWQVKDQDVLDLLKSMEDSETPAFEPLLTDESGHVLVAEMTSGAWLDSKVIVLANASLVCNLSLIHPGNRQVVDRLIEELPKENVAFLSGATDPVIHTRDQAHRQQGFEMLTIWPINVITLHGLFLGLLMLLVAFPIFGRAKRLPTKSLQDFGQHIEATGSLLRKSKDRFYALATIADYFRDVRKEPTSPWANVDADVQKEASSPFAAK